MTRTIRLRREARAEFDEAAAAYERERPGLGRDFVARVQAVLDRIVAMPEGARILFEDVRRANVRRFPYGVFCRVEPDAIAVIAIFHGSRDPKAWKSRLS